VIFNVQFLSGVWFIVCRAEIAYSLRFWLSDRNEIVVIKGKRSVPSLMISLTLAVLRIRYPSCD